MKIVIRKRKPIAIRESAKLNTINFYNALINRLLETNGVIDNAHLNKIQKENSVSFSTFSVIKRLGFIKEVEKDLYKANNLTINFQDAEKIVRLRNHLVALRNQEKKNGVIKIKRSTDQARFEKAKEFVSKEVYTPKETNNNDLTISDPEPENKILPKKRIINKRRKKTLIERIAEKIAKFFYR